MWARTITTVIISGCSSMAYTLASRAKSWWIISFSHTLDCGASTLFKSPTYYLINLSCTYTWRIKLCCICQGISKIKFIALFVQPVKIKILSLSAKSCHSLIEESILSLLSRPLTYILVWRIVLWCVIFLIQNSFPMTEWHVEHMKKIVIKFVTGLSENATNWEKR
jgi:hypothetical protein